MDWTYEGRRPVASPSPSGERGRVGQGRAGIDQRKEKFDDVMFNDVVYMFSLRHVFLLCVMYVILTSSPFQPFFWKIYPPMEHSLEHKKLGMEIK